MRGDAGSGVGCEGEPCVLPLFRGKGFGEPALVMGVDEGFVALGEGALGRGYGSDVV